MNSCLWSPFTSTSGLSVAGLPFCSFTAEGSVWQMWEDCGIRNGLNLLPSTWLVLSCSIWPAPGPSTRLPSERIWKRKETGEIPSKFQVNFSFPWWTANYRQFLQHSSTHCPDQLPHTWACRHTWGVFHYHTTFCSPMSPFFLKVCSSRWKESENRVVPYPHLTHKQIFYQKNLS